MKAVAVTTFGGPEALEVVDLPEPHPGPGQVRIKVAGAAVNPTDTLLRAGLYKPEGPPPYIPGMDVAGTVDAVGDGAADGAGGAAGNGVKWSVGDEVMAVVVPTRPEGGAYAEQVLVPAASLARIPAAASLIEASSLPMNAMTARQTLDQLALPAGATLAVTGAAGAYGGYVVQLAKVAGLRVIADASEEDEALVRSLGADVVLRRGPGYVDAVLAEVPGGVDAVADGALFEGSIAPAIRDGGGLAVIRGWRGDPGRGISVHRTLVSRDAERGDKLDGLRRLVEEGLVTLRVAGTFPPEEAPDAHRRLEAGGVRGRLVIDFR